MAYTDDRARKDLAKRLYEVQASRRAGNASSSWHSCSAEVRREYERDVEKFFDPTNEEVVEALAQLGFGCDACST
jgi:hypothetical protein